MIANIIYKKQRTNGPINAHQICGTYANAFKLAHVYKPRTGTEHPFEVKRNSWSICLIIVSFDLMYDTNTSSPFKIIRDKFDLAVKYVNVNPESSFI